MTKEFVRVDGLAEFGDTTADCIYAFRSRGIHNVPEPDLKVGTVLFWKRPKAEAWGRAYKARRLRRNVQDYEFSRRTTTHNRKEKAAQHSKCCAAK